MDNAQCTMYNGQWTIDNAQCNAQWTMDCEECRHGDESLIYMGRRSPSERGSSGQAIS